MKVLTIFLIATITSGCANTLVEPLCLPERPVLQDISIEEQIEINPHTLLKVAENDLKLKSHVRRIERITEAHNEQFKAKCFGSAL